MDSKAAAMDNKAAAMDNKAAAMGSRVVAMGSKVEVMAGMTAVMGGAHREEIATAKARPVTVGDMEDDLIKVDTHAHSNKEVGMEGTMAGTGEARGDPNVKRAVTIKARDTAPTQGLHMAEEAGMEAERMTTPAQCIMLSSTQDRAEMETCSSRPLAHLEVSSSIFKTNISTKAKLFRPINRCMGTKVEVEAEAEAQLMLRAWAWLPQCKLSRCSPAAREVVVQGVPARINSSAWQWARLRSSLISNQLRAMRPQEVSRAPLSPPRRWLCRCT